MNYKQGVILKLNMEIGDNLYLIEVINYIPNREAPACSNPNSPLFSDCGDPSEWDDYVAYRYDENIKNYILIKGTVFYAKYDKIITDYIFEHGDEAYYRIIQNR